MKFRRVLAIMPLLATALLLGVAVHAQSNFHRAEQDLEITYWLQDPSTHQFKISHDFTLTRVGQKYAHSFVRAGSAVNPDSKMFNVDTGKELKTYTVTGKSVNDLKYYPTPTAPDSVVVQGDLDQPIAEGQSVRIRVEETYTDPVGYTMDKDELVWKRTLGRPLDLRNSARGLDAHVAQRARHHFDGRSGPRADALHESAQRRSEHHYQSQAPSCRGKRRLAPTSKFQSAITRIPNSSS